ncbi:unnamed protein product [Rhizoctonia solani]|uniref:Uncharacterized protein n=1 Tax=Rhizoctonia solani TaxID=456999 RepID=A0A8H3BCV7_9AGAM|nr:unnamed protein product [Rhizoctonia solani]
MAPRNKTHRTLSATNRTHSTTSLHKGEGRLAGLTTIHKDKPAGNPRDALHKTKKHSSSSSALAAKRTASKTSVHRASTTRLPQQQQQMKQEPDANKKQGDDEGWVSSDEDDELDEDEILVLQTQRAQRNAREAEKLKAAAKAAEAEILAKQREDEDSEHTVDSGGKHSNMSQPTVESPSSFPQAMTAQLAQQPSPPVKPQPPAVLRHPQSQTARQPLPSHQPELARNHPGPLRQVPTLAPVIQHVPDHTKHTFPSKASPSPPAPHPSARNVPTYLDPSATAPQTNGAHDKAPPNDHSSDHRHRLDDHSASRPSVTYPRCSFSPTPSHSCTVYFDQGYSSLVSINSPSLPLCAFGQSATIFLAASRNAINLVTPAHPSTESFKFHTHPSDPPSLTHRSLDNIGFVPPALATFLSNHILQTYSRTRTHGQCSFVHGRASCNTQPPPAS